jgi:serine/threonine protein kinase
LSDAISGKYEDYLPPEQQCLHQMAAGVQHIHSNDLVHGNLKPDNILICNSDGWVRLKVADFSCSKREKGRISINTKTIASLHYLAPELLQVMDKDQVQTNELQVPQMTNASDVFALGCVFYKFLTKAHPFGKENILSNIRNGHFDLSGTLISSS